MTIKTIVKHKATEYTDFTTQYGVDKIGFNLKLLEFVAKGYTNGSFTTSRAVDPELGNVVINTRVWTNQDVANEWVTLVLSEHPSQISAEVVID